MRRAAAALIVTALWSAGIGAQQTSTATVLERIAGYVSAYQKQLIGVVAEEYYRQNAVNTSRGGRQSRQFRELRSDVLLVKLPDEDYWLQFRDVFEVDRKPVRDRDQRLYKLFVTPTAHARAQAETIQHESSRHNIGPVQRTINMPILALLFFETSHHSRQIERLAADNSRRFEPLAPAEHVCVVLTATIQVNYGAAPGFTLLLPAEMRERYRLRVNESRIDGRATYDKFRQFTVTTIEKPKQE